MVLRNNRWKEDIAASVAEYNAWYLRFSATAYQEARAEAVQVVERTLKTTNFLRRIDAATLWRNPGIIQGLRMTSSPTWAVDRLIGISGAKASLIKNMEENSTGRNRENKMRPHTEVIIATIVAGIDHNLLPWLDPKRAPTPTEYRRAFEIMTDRLAISIANPVIRNEQETRQIRALSAWLDAREYRNDPNATYERMIPGTYRVQLKVQGRRDNGNNVNIPVDIAIMPAEAAPGSRPILMECKSAGDFANVNKRRKEESDKHRNLVNRYGDGVLYVLYLSGYFDANYLAYEQDAGIQCFWHHRIEDLGQLGL